MTAAEYDLLRQAIPAYEVALRSLQTAQFTSACAKLDPVRQRIVQALIRSILEDGVETAEALDLIEQVTLLLGAE